MTHQKSSQSIPGMGAIVLENGTAFRVWAPNADSVSVIGDFNDWQPSRHTMTKEKNSGTWFTVADEAKEGQAYAYLIRNGGNEFRRSDPRARKMENSVGNSIIWKAKPELAGEKFTPATLDQMVIYELHIGSFNVPDGEKVGNFTTAMEKLSYLQNLGVNAVEIMPVAEFSGDLSWGYNPAYPYAVESAYGGPEGLLAFIKAAHEHGIAVIIDVVYNHFGPSDLGLWQFDGWSENGKGGIYFYNDHRSGTPWGDSRPDYGRGEVRTYLRDNAMMWLEEYQADGLRWDMSLFIRSINGNTKDPNDEIKEGWGLLQWINNDVHQAFPSAITIAEDLQDNAYLVKDTGVGGAGFNSQWHAAFVHTVRDTMIQTEDQYRNMDALVAALMDQFDGDAFKRVIYSESHDEVANGKMRLPSEISPDSPDALPALKRANLAASLVFTAPGIPMIFQGQEFLTDEWFRDDVPLDWSKPETYRGVVKLYSDLAKLRLNKFGYSAGLSGHNIEIFHFDREHKFLAFKRWRDAGDEVIVAVNLANNRQENVKIGVPKDGLWKVRFYSASVFYDFEPDTIPCLDAQAQAEPWSNQPYSIELSLEGYSAAIFSQDKAG